MKWKAHSGRARNHELGGRLHDGRQSGILNGTCTHRVIASATIASSISSTASLAQLGEIDDAADETKRRRKHPFQERSRQVHGKAGVAHVNAHAQHGCETNRGWKWELY